MDLYINYDEVILINNVLREYHEMKESIKNPLNISYKEQWQFIVSVVKEILEPKNIVIKKLKKLGYYFYQFVLIVVRKNQGSSKIKNYTNN